MKNITKTDEGTVVWAKPKSGAVQKRKIIRVWEDADSYEFKYCWDHYLGNDGLKFMIDNDGFSRQSYQDVASNWKIAETIARYDQPLSFWRELKIVAIRVVHLILERLEFNFKN